MLRSPHYMVAIARASLICLLLLMLLLLEGTDRCNVSAQGGKSLVASNFVEFFESGDGSQGGADTAGVVKADQTRSDARQGGSDTSGVDRRGDGGSTATVPPVASSSSIRAPRQSRPRRPTVAADTANCSRSRNPISIQGKSRGLLSNDFFNMPCPGCCPPDVDACYCTGEECGCCTMVDYYCADPDNGLCCPDGYYICSNSDEWCCPVENNICCLDTETCCEESSVCCNNEKRSTDSSCCAEGTTCCGNGELCCNTEEEQVCGETVTALQDNPDDGAVCEVPTTTICPTESMYIPNAVMASADTLYSFPVGQGEGNIYVCPNTQYGIIFDMGSIGGLGISVPAIEAYVGLGTTMTHVTIFVSHSDADHYNLFSSFTTLTASTVDLVVYGGALTTDYSTDFQNWIKPLKSTPVKTCISSQCPTFTVCGGGSTTVTMLAANTQPRDGGTPIPNSLSIVLQINSAVAMLFAGDMSDSSKTGGEVDYLVSTLGNSLQSPFYKIAHHGADTLNSNSLTWVQKVAAKTAFVSGQRQSTYWHPRCSVWGRMESTVYIYPAGDCGADRYREVCWQGNSGGETDFPRVGSSDVYLHAIWSTSVNPNNFDGGSYILVYIPGTQAVEWAEVTDEYLVTYPTVDIAND